MAGAEMSVSDEIAEDFDLDDYADAMDNIVLLQSWIKGHLTRKSMKDIRSRFEAIITETEQESRYNLVWKSQNICLPTVQKKRSRKSKPITNKNLELSQTKSQKQKSLLTAAGCCTCSNFSDDTVVNDTGWKETDFNQDEAFTDVVASGCTSACVCGRTQNTALTQNNSLSHGDKTDVTDSTPGHAKPSQDSLSSSQDILKGEITLDGSVSEVQGQLLRENINNSSVRDDINLGSANISTSNLHACDKKVVNEDIHGATSVLTSTNMDDNRNVAHALHVADNMSSTVDITNRVTDNETSHNTRNTLVSQKQKAGPSGVSQIANVDCSDVLQTTPDGSNGVSHTAGEIGTETAQGRLDESSSHWADSTSFWGGDESHTAGLHGDHQPEAEKSDVWETDPAELREKRHHIAMELLWVQQAIHSRKNYLRLKQQMKATKG